jgi:putative ABC transport system ATP-binding protein
MVEPLIELKSVSKTFKTKNFLVKALEDINLEIKPGSFNTIMGPSGSGKSSLLLTIGAMLEPSKGKLIISEIKPYALGATGRLKFRRENIGFIFQNFNLIPYLSARDNISFCLYLRGYSNDEQRKITNELLEKVGLLDRAEHRPSELSIGECQRIALARAIGHKPKIILADEPTGNLDYEKSQDILTLLKEITGLGVTVILASHDPQVEKYADERYRIEKGIIKESA